MSTLWIIVWQFSLRVHFGPHSCFSVQYVCVKMLSRMANEASMREWTEEICKVLSVWQGELKRRNFHYIFLHIIKQERSTYLQYGSDVSDSVTRSVMHMLSFPSPTISPYPSFSLMPFIIFIPISVQCLKCHWASSDCIQSPTADGINFEATVTCSWTETPV